jgi:hypothetical protein
MQMTSWDGSKQGQRLRRAWCCSHTLLSPATPSWSGAQHFQNYWTLLLRMQAAMVLPCEQPGPSTTQLQQQAPGRPTQCCSWQTWMQQCWRSCPTTSNWRSRGSWGWRHQQAQLEQQQAVPMATEGQLQLVVAGA